MSQTVALRVPQELYEALRVHAAKRGQTPDGLAIEWLAETIQRTEVTEEDPLASFAGFIESNQADWIDRHDEYIGAAAHFGEDPDVKSE